MKCVHSLSSSRSPLRQCCKAPRCPRCLPTILQCWRQELGSLAAAIPCRNAERDHGCIEELDTRLAKWQYTNPRLPSQWPLEVLQRKEITSIFLINDAKIITFKTNDGTTVT